MQDIVVGFFIIIILKVLFLLLLFFFFFFVFLPFLGLLPQHMEVPRLGIEWELL